MLDIPITEDPITGTRLLENPIVETRRMPAVPMLENPCAGTRRTSAVRSWTIWSRTQNAYRIFPSRSKVAARSVDRKNR